MSYKQSGHGDKRNNINYAQGPYRKSSRPLRKRNRRGIIIGAIAAVILVGLCVAAFGATKLLSKPDVEDTIVEVSENTEPSKQTESDTRLLVSDSLNLDKPTEHVVYLTFDDGPSTNTDRIISTLKEKGAVATWFIKGNSEHLSKVKDIWDSGNQVAIHTYDHNYQTIYASESAFWLDVEKTANAIEEILGFTPPKLLRFPGGSFNNFNRSIADRLTDSTGERGWHYFDWNVSCGDGSENPYTPEDLAGFVIAEADGNNSSCVLMHDSDAKDTTAEALPAIIDYFSEQGYIFKVLDAESFGYHF